MAMFSHEGQDARELELTSEHQIIASSGSLLQPEKDESSLCINDLKYWARGHRPLQPAHEMSTYQ
uniref:Uncharacterized protein n=1 Tax=Romanomermis culicivorax TaxID=13658 RepID=A0A915KM07_ROMCU